MNKFIMIFADGVGIGKKDYENNPFFRKGFKSFKNIFGAVPDLDNQVMKQNGVYLFPSDACMGVPGLPQSGTGQTSIFCGLNAPKLIDKHFGPYPYSTLIPYIEKENIFKSFLDLNKKVSFVNAYPERFFEYIKAGNRRLSVTTMSCKLTGIKLNQYDELIKEKGISAEITNDRWNKIFNYNLPVISPEAAAERLLKISEDNDFILFEYFLTDYFGHGRYMDEFDYYYDVFDRFLYSVITKLNNATTTFILCSDHGNLEDMSVKTHTFNPALTITSGKYGEYLFNNIKDLSDIKKAIMNCL